jgi:hypothetical protein
MYVRGGSGLVRPLHCNLHVVLYLLFHFVPLSILHLKWKPTVNGNLSVWIMLQWINFSIYLILPAALGPAIYSASKRNEYQKQKYNVSGEQSLAGAYRWQPYGHLWAVCLDQCIRTFFLSRTPWLGFSFMSTPSHHYPRPFLKSFLFLIFLG